MASSVISCAIAGSGIRLRRYNCQKNEALTLSVANSERGLIVGAGAGGTSTKCMYIYNTSSSGAVTYEEIKNSSGVSFDVNTANAIVITNTTGAYMTFLFIAF